MRRKLGVSLRVASAAGVLFAVAAAARAGQYTENFNDGTADNFTLTGMHGDPPNRVVDPAVVNNGNLRLTGASNSWTGNAFLGDLDPGRAIQGFTANFSLAIGPGTSPPADGLSFVFGQLTGAEEFGEEGPGGFNGLTISADVYDNGGGEAPAIDLKVNDVVVPGGHIVTNPYTNGAFVPVTVRLDPDGTVDLVVTGLGTVFDNVQTGFVPEAGDRFAWGARTGGLNAEHRIDDINITTTVPEPTGLCLLGLGAVGLLARRRRA